MKKLTLVLTLIVSAGGICRAALPINTDVVKKAVVFMYPARADGDPDKDHPIGTGFLVGVPKKDSSEGYLFLVTARHIVDPNWAFCPPNPERIFLRFNRTAYDPQKDNNGVEYWPVELVVNSQPLYRVSDDDQVDAAI